MTPAGYVPDRGDIVWLDFNPRIGCEQSGRQPALVLTQGHYNGRTGLLVCCPLTGRIKGYPYEVPIAAAKASVALADQVKSLDWRQRNAALLGRASAGELAQVQGMVKALLGF